MPGLGIAACAAVLFFAAGTHQARFALPLLVFLAPLAAMGFSVPTSKKLLAAKIALVLLCATLIFVNGRTAAREFKRLDPFAVVTGAESEEHYRERLIPAWPIYRQINESLPRDSRVFAILTGNFGYLFNVPYYSDSVIEDHTLLDMISRSVTSHDLLMLLKAEHFTHVFYDGRMLVKSLDATQLQLFGTMMDEFAVPIAKYQGFGLYRLR